METRRAFATRDIDSLFRLNFIVVLLHQYSYPSTFLEIGRLTSDIRDLRHQVINFFNFSIQWFVNSEMRSLFSTKKLCDSVEFWLCQGFII